MLQLCVIFATSAKMCHLDNRCVDDFKKRSKMSLAHFCIAHFFFAGRGKSAFMPVSNDRPREEEFL